PTADRAHVSSHRRRSSDLSLSGAEDIHPGYGLLAESPEFAEACAAAGITFIGPKPETMRRLGNKVAARNLAIEVGVPVIPATDPDRKSTRLNSSHVTSSDA